MSKEGLGPREHIWRNALTAESVSLAALSLVGVTFAMWRHQHAAKLPTETTQELDVFHRHASFLNDERVMTYKKGAIIKVAAALCLADGEYVDQTFLEATTLLTKENVIHGKQQLGVHELMITMTRKVVRDSLPDLYAASDVLWWAAGRAEAYPLLASTIQVTMARLPHEQP